MHTKYRPSSLNAFLGNKAVVRALQTITLDKPIMFLGAPGLGKTTLAFILANRFGAHKSNVFHYNCVNLKLDDIKGIIEQFGRRSLFGERKVYVLDEIHGLTDKSQKDLLIPLETIPHNTLVIACSTEPPKDEALIERFRIFQLLPISDDDAVTLLNYVAGQEGMELQGWKRDLIIRKSDGVPRRLLIGLGKVRDVDDPADAVFLLEKTIIDSEIRSEAVLDLFKLLLSKPSDWQLILRHVEKAIKTASPVQIVSGLVALIGARLNSDFFKKHTEEGVRLLKLHRALTEHRSVLGGDKAALIISLYYYFSGV